MATYRVTKGNVGQVFYKIEGKLKKLLEGTTKTIDENGTVEVGLHPDAQDYPEKEKGLDIPVGYATSVVLVGAVHEFGNNHVPKRPWLSASIKQDKDFYQRSIRKVMKGGVEDNAKIAEGMKALGEIAVKNVQSHVESNSIGMVPNAPSTIRQKGGDQPLVDTSHLLRQVDWKFKDGTKG